MIVTGDDITLDQLRLLVPGYEYEAVRCIVEIWIDAHREFIDNETEYFIQMMNAVTGYNMNIFRQGKSLEKAKQQLDQGRSLVDVILDNIQEPLVFLGAVGW